MDESYEREDDVEPQSEFSLDCYPYSFTPLLLFTTDGYFDKGYSNYNAVAQFFSPVIKVDMLSNVLYDRKNLVYEELFDLVTRDQMLVVCCIDAHFTAFQVVKTRNGKPAALLYDPIRPSLSLFSGESYKVFCLFMLLKCNYGDSQHIQDNKEQYQGINANDIRRNIYQLWKKINTIASVASLYNVQQKSVSMNAEHYFLINNPRNARLMSTQLTGNTCYFQTFLFGVLCKVADPVLNRDGTVVDLNNLDVLQKTTVNMSRFMLNFFSDGSCMRPLTNSNLVIDFGRFQRTPYFSVICKYLSHMKLAIPSYEQSYRQIMVYLESTKCLHNYSKCTLDGPMPSTPNTKHLQAVTSTGDAVWKLAHADYYKYRATNFMFGFNAGILLNLSNFCEFNSWRKNQLLRFYEQLQPVLEGCAAAIAQAKESSKYRDYYFMAQYEVAQLELVDIHHYTFLIDQVAMSNTVDSALRSKVNSVNQVLADHILFSTQKTSTYDKIVANEKFRGSKKYFRAFLNEFMSVDFLTTFVGLGFADVNPKEKDINSLTQTVFYSADLMKSQANRQSYEFEKECINQMARSTLRKCLTTFDGEPDMQQKYRVDIRIGHGFTYSKYSTYMHFLNVVECYWNNPDLSNIQVFGKDIRTLLALSSQKIFFEKGHSGYYYYGPFETQFAYRNELDLAVASSFGNAVPGVSRLKRKKLNHLILTDRVFEYHHTRSILKRIFEKADGVRFKTDNEVLNLCLLSQMLDFGLFRTHVGLLHLPFLQSLQHNADTHELQVEIANHIFEFDRKNSTDSVTRSTVEELLFECSHKFLVNKDFPVHSEQFKLIRVLNADPDYQSYVLLCKIYMSLCQINKSVEVDYYKVHCNGEFRIIIPNNYSKTTGEYLDVVSKRYTFSVRDGFMMYDGLSVFDLRPQQPEINLHKVRFDSATNVESMVKYIEISNVLKVVDSDQYMVFIADNVLLVEVLTKESTTIKIGHIEVEVATMFFNEAISFIPCFKYSESEDIVLFSSSNIHYAVDKGGQFATDYYGMKHELTEFILSEEIFVDLNDEHVFKQCKLSELLTESKTVFFFPDYLLQVPNRQELINLLDIAVRVRNVSFFILVLYYLRRASVALEYICEDDSVTKISGPWLEAIKYVLNRGSSNSQYDAIFSRQFFNLNQYQDVPLDDFIEILCKNFTKYQRHTEKNEYQIVPRPKQKAFLKHIICAQEPFHFSEVGSGKTKVVLPLLCQIFLSNNSEAHTFLARGGKPKDVLVVLVPEHLVVDARTQVFRYCLNLNFREEYRVHDDIFALLHQNVRLDGRKKQIFVTSFNQFKKALTYDVICVKVQSHREQILVIADEVDDFLDRDKLVFNICSNMSNSFDKLTLELYFEVSQAAYQSAGQLDATLNNVEKIDSSPNPVYWHELFKKFCAILSEIQDASRSINKSFGIFNEETLRHCSTNIIHDIEGYKSLIARPYESVNRAMPGSYYSDVERTIILTYVILTEDISKYNGLFQGERKFISFDYWNSHFIHQLEYDDLVYGHETLSEIVDRHPETKVGLALFLYEIILRRMEIRDQSRSVNSIDVVFNFDCIGFTGTPFIDNYPTFRYIRARRTDTIPDLIDRSFYAYSCDEISNDEFERRFALFQGQNSDVKVRYVSSDFIRASLDEMNTLESIFAREERTRLDNDTMRKSGSIGGPFNALVDLCGIFKRSTIHDVRNLIKTLFADQFQYIYHIDQTDNSDRVLCIDSDNDVQYDEEFYKYLCKSYGIDLRSRIFFFIDNRNVIGKDIPFQLNYQRQFGLPLFTKSVILAHDVEDFSKIWQAMGRSRTMNDTVFTIYKSSIPEDLITSNERHGPKDIKQQDLTKHLYVRNCDSKVAGNISSIYLTVIALYNLSKGSFYYRDEIVNTFLEKMEGTLEAKVERLQKELIRYVLGIPVPAGILLHILVDKFRKSSNKVVTETPLSEEKVEELLCHIVKQKFEIRVPSGDLNDTYIVYLTGEQKNQMEISYTKQQQKQKQTQKTKTQDSDAMGVFDKKNQLVLSISTDNYFDYVSKPNTDFTKLLLNLPASKPIHSIVYTADNKQSTIKIYPTLQFLYSHHVHGSYLSTEATESFRCFDGNVATFLTSFYDSVERDSCQASLGSEGQGEKSIGRIGYRVLTSFVRQNPLYTLAGLEKGVYIIGMKDQFNIHDLPNHPLGNRIQYVADDTGFILFDRTCSKSLDTFGPYCYEHYILLELLSKHEIAQNVLTYYGSRKEALQQGLTTYDEKQGRGFICWRFLMNEARRVSNDERDDPGSVKRNSTDNDAMSDSSTPVEKKQRAGNGEVTPPQIAEGADDVTRTFEATTIL